jgi:hypothetical protein
VAWDEGTVSARPETLAPVDISTGIPTWTYIEAALENDALFEIAEALTPLTTPDPTMGGVKRMFPTWMLLLYEELLSVWKSARHVDAELRHPRSWEWLREQIVERFPDQPDLHLPDEAIRRHHFLYFHRAYLSKPEIQEAWAEAHTRIAARQAVEIGLLDPDGPGSWTHPDSSRMLYGDGKVLTPRLKGKPDDPPRLNRSTGELRERQFDPDAGLHFEGGREEGDLVWGTKWVMILARGEAPHSRMILDVAWVESPGGEADVAIESISSIRPLAPGAQGVRYDKALRGKHKQALLQQGLLPLIGVHAQTAARKTAKGVMPRIPKDAHVEDKMVTLRDGTTKRCRVHAIDGELCLVEFDLHGKPTPFALKRGRIKADRTVDGAYRWYGEYELPEAFGGGGTLTIRLDLTPEDEKSGFNRTEVLSPIPSSDDDFKKLGWLRNDAESNNSALEDTLFNKRAHSIGHLSQRANLLGYALLINSLTLYLAKRRGGVRGDLPPPVTIAA